jgi:hypothetical protein
VLGISPDPVAKVKKFHDKEGLNFALLADEGHHVVDAYGVWASKSLYKVSDTERASIRGNILATYVPSDPSDASGKPRCLDTSDVPGPIYGGRPKLRALWGDFPVVVRVHLGALRKPY